MRDFCRLLGEALTAQGADYTLEHVGWDEVGWLRALGQLWRKSATWKEQWILAQYTALSWSRHGFSLLFLLVLLVLRIRKARIAVIFHDRAPYKGKRWVDKVKGTCHFVVMRASYWMSERSIHNVPLEDVSWLAPKHPKATFIPVGANVPSIVAPVGTLQKSRQVRTITVFGITGEGNVGDEVSDIVFAAKAAAERVPRLRLVTLGRGSLESEAKFRQAIDGSPVEYHALGVLSDREVSQALADSDLSLFVRGPISTQRGSAIASIACGLPVVAYAHPRLPAPLAEAGIVGVRCADLRALAEATVLVLTDDQLRCELRERSRRAHERYFCWEIVAAHYLAVLSDA